MFKELKKTIIKEVKKGMMMTMSHQVYNTNRDRNDKKKFKEANRNSEAEKYNNKNKKFTRGAINENWH